MVRPDGSRYQGDWINGHKEGFGMEKSKGIIYKG